MSGKTVSQSVENGCYRVGKVTLAVNPHPDNRFVPGPQYFMAAGDTLERVAWAVSENLPVLLVGETGVGKTLMVRHLAHMTNNGFRRVNLNGMTTVDEFVGKLMINEGGTYWVNGILIEAMEVRLSREGTGGRVWATRRQTVPAPARESAGVPPLPRDRLPDQPGERQPRLPAAGGRGRDDPRPR